MKSIWHSYLVLNLGNYAHETLTKTGLRMARILLYSEFWPSVAGYEHKRIVSLRIFFLSFRMNVCKNKLSAQRLTGYLSRLNKAEIYDFGVPEFHDQDKKFLADTLLDGITSPN